MDVSPVLLLLDSANVSVSVWPPGSNIYLDESVLLRCTVESDSSFVWSYQWLRHRLHPAQTPNPRHLVSGDSYSITAVTREDAGSYQCQAELREVNISSLVILSRQVVLRVSDRPPPLLTLTPSSRQIFRGECFSVQCPSSLSQMNSSGWTLRRFPPRSGLFFTDQCSPLGGTVSTERPDTCAFTAVRENGGLYWCEGEEGRSNAVSISVSYGFIILRSPSSPVLLGDSVDLFCQYWTGNNGTTSFYKNGAEITTSTSSSGYREIKMRIEKMTQEDEGLYKCVSGDGRMESPESWLSVRPDQGSWMWITASCGLLLLLLVPLSVWLVHRYRYQAFCTRSCWPVSTEEPGDVGLPATKQDVTEVQWDLSWMEMSNLLDKQLYPGT
ncbi:uncharacterized protein LOC117828570 [Notolabrus celidotus]|uniref:uncharacterized protein LOC117828570 n=1 Tax=Notolabrus celidotus TaxID=1203425 RepID=UPI00148FD2AD|nr:uncharacterized protein LOC117828570 [Notolabrus celidotus]